MFFHQIFSHSLECSNDIECLSPTTFTRNISWKVINSLLLYFVQIQFMGHSSFIYIRYSWKYVSHHSYEWETSCLSKYFNSILGKHYTNVFHMTNHFILHFMCFSSAIQKNQKIYPKIESLSKSDDSFHWIRWWKCVVEGNTVLSREMLIKYVTMEFWFAINMTCSTFFYCFWMPNQYQY